MPIPRHLLGSHTAHDAGSLALSHVKSHDSAHVLRAASWRNSLAKVGIAAPLFVVHDLGLLFAADPRSAPIGRRDAVPMLSLPPEMEPELRRYETLLTEVAHSEVTERARAWRLSDDLVAVLLLKILAPIHERFAAGRRLPTPAPLSLDGELYRDLDGQLASLYSAVDRSFDMAYLRHVAASHLRIVTNVEQIDLDTLRLLGLFGAEAGAANVLGMLDLLAVLGSPEANDVVNFSLDLLPSVLETKKAGGQQIFGMDGFAGIARRGSLDSLVLSELALPDELFAQRFMENELFYYAHEKENEQEVRLHYIAIDASASMRGQRQTFARGLALTLAKKLLLRGEEVALRFFDSRLHEQVRAKPGRRSDAGLNVPYLLSFRGERGRNYARVFALLGDELARLVRRERKNVVLYLLTHGECHIPPETVELLRRSATLYGIFILPSVLPLELDYLSRLHRAQVVDAKTLSDRTLRARRALDIVADVAGESPAAARRSTVPPPPAR